MRIFYVCTQYPSNGGAATEVYEAVKRLRARGHTADVLFMLAGQREVPLADPDGIGGVLTCQWQQRHVCARAVPADYDLYVGKNYEAPVLISEAGRHPCVYLTSGIDYISKIARPMLDIADPPPPDGVDLRAFRAADHVLVHSTIDFIAYENLWPTDLYRKIRSGVVYTPNLAVRPVDRATLPPYEKRRFDLVFSASTWKRIMKNGPLMRRLVEHFRDGRRILVCGEDAGVTGAETPGRVTHVRMIEYLKQSRVVVIPSLYDPSPNLYAEAAACGCNIVVNPNVGNAEFHPAGLVTADMRPESFVAAIARALALKSQEQYRTPTADEATDQLIERFQQIIALGKAAA